MAQQCPHCQHTVTNTEDRFCSNCGGILPLEVSGAPVVPPPLPPPTSPTEPTFIAPQLPPGFGVAGPGPAAGIPWEQRDRLGFLTAFIETTRQVLLAPTDFFKAMPVTGGLGAPFVYGVLAGYIGLAVQAVYDAILRTIVGPRLDPFSADPRFAQLAGFFEGGVGLVGTLIAGPFLLALFLFVGAGITHLFLLLLGGARRGFEATFRVVAYSSAAALFSILPFCGGLVGLVWRAVAMILGLAEAHGIGKGTAAGAVLLPALLVCCCCLVGVLFAIGGMASLAGLAQ
jgi:hypothetical protein